MTDWLLRTLKGMVIGVGFVVPGMSASALAVVLGLYERIIEFMAHITKDFMRNVFFFIPVGVGGLLGVFLIAVLMSFLLKDYKTPVLWFFVGAMLGTLPDLWQKAGKKGRKPYHSAIMVLTFILGTVFLLSFGITEKPVVDVDGQMIEQLKPLPAFIAGIMVAFSALIPGLSSSNFLVLLGLYEQWTGAVKSLNIVALIPFVAGFVLFIFPFSKGIEFLFKKTFTGFFHFIVGTVLASIVLIAAIASKGYDYLQIGALVCLITLVAGTAFSYWMCNVGKKHEKISD